MPFESPFNALRNQFRRPSLQLIDTEEVDAVTSTLSVGQFEFNASDYPSGTVFRIKSTFQVSVGTVTGTVLLYNLTDSEAVTGTTLTTVSITADSQTSVAIPVGVVAGDLKTSAKTYEVRLSVTGTLVSEIVSVGSFTLSVL